MTADFEPDDLPRTSRRAMAALVLGFLSIVLVLPAFPALVLGYLALGDVARSGGKLEGRAEALTGIVLGALSLVVLPPVVLFVLLNTGVLPRPPVAPVVLTAFA